MAKEKVRSQERPPLPENIKSNEYGCAIVLHYVDFIEKFSQQSPESAIKMKQYLEELGAEPVSSFHFLNMGMPESREGVGIIARLTDRLSILPDPETISQYLLGKIKHYPATGRIASYVFAEANPHKKLISSGLPDDFTKPIAIFANYAFFNDLKTISATVLEGQVQFSLTAF